jgi:bifunctional non-homologous end joining protein LigD
MTTASTTMRVAGHDVNLSNLQKILYPESGFTKADVIDYYGRVAPAILPHLEGRALTLKRYPNGVTNSFFYEKNCPSHRPDWVKTAPIQGRDTNGPVNYCVMNNLADLLWVANLASLELHTSLAMADNPDRPTLMVFDLDPGPPADMLDAIRVGLLLRHRLASLGLQCLPKTSGGKGLHIYVPLNTAATFEQTKSFANTLAQSMRDQYPTQVVSAMRKDQRAGKVFIDWSQNDRHKTTVCAYSLRARSQPTVSTPVRWSELERALKTKNAAAVSFRASQVLERIAKQGDLFHDAACLRQKLPSAAS